MIANLVTKLANVISGTGIELNAPARNRRVNRRYSFCQGIEGLEMRLSPTMVVPPLITVTNQSSGSSSTQSQSTYTNTVSTGNIALS